MPAAQMHTSPATATKPHRKQPSAEIQRAFSTDVNGLSSPPGFDAPRGGSSRATCSSDAIASYQRTIDSASRSLADYAPPSIATSNKVISRTSDTSRSPPQPTITQPDAWSRPSSNNSLFGADLFRDWAEKTRLNGAATVNNTSSLSLQSLTIRTADDASPASQLSYHTPCNTPVTPQPGSPVISHGSSDAATSTDSSADAAQSNGLQQAQPSDKADWRQRDEQSGPLPRASSYTVSTASSSPLLPFLGNASDSDTAIAGQVYVIPSLQLKRARKQQQQVRQQVQPSPPLLLQHQPAAMMHQLQTSQHHSISTPLLNIDGTLNVVPHPGNRNVGPTPPLRTLSLPAATPAHSIGGTAIVGGIVSDQMLQHGFLYVKTVVEGGVAHRAGILPGDVVTEFADHRKDSWLRTRGGPNIKLAQKLDQWPLDTIMTIVVLRKIVGRGQDARRLALAQATAKCQQITFRIKLGITDGKKSLGAVLATYPTIEPKHQLKTLLSSASTN